MTTLVFLAALAAIFAVVLATEVTGRDSLRLHRPTGLIAWLTGGNWPAKIGGALIIVGVGALLRFALVNIELPPQLKLGAGIAIALALGLASTFVPAGAAKRPVSLALGGAAFGVAYLTAYSAFGLFHYVSNPIGVALLGVTAAAAGVYAVTRGAQSLAVLSMVGAFLAPAFAVDDPGPLVVYGYYAGASLLTLAMVAMRGWRPLIHLSFLFTLAGGLFFAWTAKYYEGAHADAMLPMLLLLAAIHVAMPICENRGGGRRWVERLDVVYMLALPVVSALLAVVISPERVYLSTELIALGTIWAIATAALGALRRTGAAAHAAIAAALMLLGVAARFRDLPWELIGLALAVGALGIAVWRRPLGRVHDVLAGIVTLFGALHILGSLASSSSVASFDAVPFVERIVAAALLIGAGAMCRRIRQALDTLLLAVGILWAFFAVGIELVRWQLVTLSLVTHWFFLLVAGSLWIRGRKVRVADERVVLLTVLILATAVWSALHASAIASWVSLAGASLALIGIAVRPLNDDEKDPRGERFGAALAAPVVAAIWASRAGVEAGAAHPAFFSMMCGVAVAIGTLALGRFVKDERSAWLENATDVFAVGFAALLGGATLLFIVRDPAAVTLEGLCVAGLVLATAIRRQLDKPIELAAAVCVAGVALLIQANLMRLLGPAGDMNIADVLALKWPAVISLLWAVVGSALTIWSRKMLSRVLWISGATLLVGAAVKLLLLDFGSLGQLANILAVIAAGAVFLLVGWLAPMPPARPQSSPREPKPAPAPAPAHSPAPAQRSYAPAAARTGYNGWTLAGVVAAGAVLVFQGQPLFRMYRTFSKHNVERHSYPAAPAPPIAASVQPEAVIEPPAPTRAVAEAELRSPAQAVAAQEMPSPTRAVAEQELPSPTRAVAEPEPPHVPQTSAAGSIAKDSAVASEPNEPRTWKAPPTVDEHGVRSYSDYNYPQAAGGQESRSPASASAPATGIAPPPPAPKEQGLDQLMREGRLRRATPRDLDAWRAATGSKRVPNLRAAGYGENEPIDRYYVVVREMTYPDGLFGAHAVTFIIPHGVPRPYGTAGHSTVLETP